MATEFVIVLQEQSGQGGTAPPPVGPPPVDATGSGWQGVPTAKKDFSPAPFPDFSEPSSAYDPPVVEPIPVGTPIDSPMGSYLDDLVAEEKKKEVQADWQAKQKAGPKGAYMDALKEEQEAEELKAQIQADWEAQQKQKAPPIQPVTAGVLDAEAAFPLGVDPSEVAEKILEAREKADAEEREMRAAKKKAEALEDAVERELEALEQFDPLKEAMRRYAAARDQEQEEERAAAKARERAEREDAIEEALLSRKEQSEPYIEKEARQRAEKAMTEREFEDERDAAASDRKRREQELEDEIQGRVEEIDPGSSMQERAKRQAAEEIRAAREAKEKRDEEEAYRKEVAENKARMAQKLNPGEKRSDLLSAADEKTLGTGQGMSQIQSILKSVGMGGTAGTMGTISNLMGGGAAGAAGAAGASGAMAAAGPIGLAVMAVQEVVGKLAGTLDGARKGIELFGDVVKDSASNNYMGAFNRVVDAATGGLEQIPIVGKLYASELQLAVAPIRAFTEVTNAFVARGRELSGYSGQLASAEASSDVMRLMADIKEANNLGGGMAELMTAQTRFELAFRDLVEPIKKYIVERLASIMDKAAAFMEGIEPAIQITKVSVMGLLEIAQAMLTWDVKAGAKSWDETFKKIAEILHKMDQKNDTSNVLIDAFMGMEHASDSAVQNPRADRPARPPILGM